MDQDKPDSSQRPLHPQWQQSPSQPLPQQPYPQFQPPVYPPPPKKPRKRVWVGIAVAFSLLVLLAGLSQAFNGPSSSSTSPSSQAPQTAVTPTQAVQPTTQVAQPTTRPTVVPTPKPTQPPKWTTVQQFSGNGTKKTAIFTVPDDWKILWSCDPSSSYGGQYNLIVTVTASDNTPVDIAINTICKAGNTSDQTEEHQGGQVYLDIQSEAAWTVQVQELK